jgi:hypothetical protein
MKKQTNKGKIQTYLEVWKSLKKSLKIPHLHKAKAGNSKQRGKTKSKQQ